MEQKKSKGIPVGRIVKIVDGTMSGNKPDSITKILSRPGSVKDNESQVGVRNCKHMLLQLCENVTLNRLSSGTYNNIGCFYERIDDMIPATNDEKKHYHKCKKLNKS